MPTIMNNRAQLTFTSNGVAETVTSNQSSTTIVDQCSIEFTKDALVPSTTPNGNVSYVVRILNNGSNDLYNPTITDDLGRGDVSVTPLTYIDDSALFFYNGNPTTGTATVSASGVIFTSPATILRPGDSLIVLYSATAAAMLTESITNTATATVNTDTDNCQCLSESDSATVEVVNSASISIFKSADKSSVFVGDSLTYTFTLMNTAAEGIEDVTFTDALPEEFNLVSVSYTQDDVTTPISADDYTLSASNVLTIPAAGSDFTIDIPAATDEGPGIVTITVTGIIG